MNKVKTLKVLKLLEVEIEKVRESAEKTDEASKDKMSGFSAAGDKYHARNASDLTKRYLQRLKLLKDEITGASSSIPETVGTPCFLEIVYDDGQSAQLYLVKNAVSLPDLSFISPDFPMGLAVLGKKTGELFSYQSKDGKTYSGKIVRLE